MLWAWLLYRPLLRTVLDQQLHNKGSRHCGSRASDDAHEKSLEHPWAHTLMAPLISSLPDSKQAPSSFSEGSQEFLDDPGSCSQTIPKQSLENAAQTAVSAWDAGIAKP